VIDFSKRSAVARFASSKKRSLGWKKMGAQCGNIFSDGGGRKFRENNSMDTFQCGVMSQPCAKERAGLEDLRTTLIKREKSFLAGGGVWAETGSDWP